VPVAERATYHFAAAPAEAAVASAKDRLLGPLTQRMEAISQAVGRVASRAERVPIGGTIGPFSLATKLIADPILPVYMAGTGVTGADDPEVRAVEVALDLSMAIVQRSVAAQIEAGAKALMVFEPAANRVYFSPKQLRQEGDVFDRFVMHPNRMVKSQLEAAGVDLILHDCGELADEMVPRLASLDPVILSLGSSRMLWEDAARVPESVVLFGNLPTKRFYAADLTIAEVERLARELSERMRATGHAFILGSECDVLSVPGAHEAIAAKVAAFMAA
jgi:uroporphyrinogen-III decarboxylase